MKSLGHPKQKKRPILQLEQPDQMRDVEIFQNKVLRPILKMQHDLIVALANERPHLSLMKKQAKNEEEYIKSVVAFIKKQADLKHQLIGVVVGQLELEEFALYKEQAAEYNKRITTMAGERIAKAMY